MQYFLHIFLTWLKDYFWCHLESFPTLNIDVVTYFLHPPNFPKARLLFADLLFKECNFAENLTHVFFKMSH